MFIHLNLLLFRRVQHFVHDFRTLLVLDFQSRKSSILYEEHSKSGNRNLKHPNRSIQPQQLDQANTAIATNLDWLATLTKGQFRPGNAMLLLKSSCLSNDSKVYVCRRS